MSLFRHTAVDFDSLGGGGKTMAHRTEAGLFTAMAQLAMTISKPSSQHWAKGLGIVCIGLFCFAQNVFAQSPNTRVIAAANSTCSSIKKAAELFAQRHDISFSYICKSSGRLAKGIKGDMLTPDYYISASEEWMNDLVQSGHVNAAAVRELWGNELILACPTKHPLDITKWEDVTSAKVAHLLIGDPGTAPFGRYAKQALESAGLWDQVKTKVGTRKHITLLADDLSVAAQGSAGILYSTNLTDELQTVLHVPSEWHDPIRYFGAAPVGKEDDALMADFISFLKSPEAVEIFSNAGFLILP